MYKKITKNDPDGKLYRIYLQLWDTAGQERYRYALMSSDLFDTV